MQFILALIIIGGYFYLIFSGRAVPTNLDTIVGLVVGFFFGGTVGRAVEQFKQMNGNKQE